MTHEERINTIQEKLGEDVDSDLLSIYLRTATQKILNHRFPYGTNLTDVEPQFEEALIELSIVLFNQRGGEGQSMHSENGITRHYRTESEILEEITPVADCFL